MPAPGVKKGISKGGVLHPTYRHEPLSFASCSIPLVCDTHCDPSLEDGASTMNTDLMTCSARFHIRRALGVVWVEGQVANNRVHRHHALQITWAAPDTVATIEVEDTSITGVCLVIDGGTPHTLSLDSGIIALLDSTSSLAARVRANYLAGTSWASPKTPAWSGEFADAERLLESLAGDEPAEKMDERIRDTLDWLDAMEDAGRWSEVTLEHALRLACLSRGRFLHLFSQEVSSPWRTYLTWRRALVAMALVAKGNNLTDAAHASGYADSAHLSRQFSDLFGVTPGAFAKNSHFLQS